MNSRPARSRIELPRGSREEDAIAGTEPLADPIPRPNQRLGVRVIYEPSEPTAAVVE